MRPEVPSLPKVTPRAAGAWAVTPPASAPPAHAPWGLRSRSRESLPRRETRSHAWPGCQADPHQGGGRLDGGTKRRERNVHSGNLGAEPGGPSHPPPRRGREQGSSRTGPATGAPQPLASSFPRGHCGGSERTTSALQPPGGHLWSSGTCPTHLTSRPLTGTEAGFACRKVP